MKNKKKVFGILTISCFAGLFVILVINRCTNVASLNDETAYEDNIRANEVKNQADYIDAESYAYIKEIYDSLDFSVSFCRVENALLHQRAYKKLLLEEKTVMIPKTGEEVFISELPEFKSDADITGNEFDPEDYTYYFFDMDGETGPELLVTDKSRFTYVFKYEPQSDQIILWQAYISHTIFFMGTRKLGFAGGWSGDGLISLDSDGNYESSVLFQMIGSEEYQNDIDAYGYFVSLPEYVELDENLKAQATYDEADERFYFRVTGAQYEALTGTYYEAVREKSEAMECVTYSYEELFESADSSFSDDIMQDNINNSFVLYDEYYWNGDGYVYEKVAPDERGRMEEDLLSMYGMTQENLYLTSIECEDGYASYGDVRMYYNDRADIYLTIFWLKYGRDDYEMEVYNVSDGSSMDKLDKSEYGILEEPYAFVSREGTTGREYVDDFQEEKQYDRMGNLVSYHSYGTDINGFDYSGNELNNVLDLLKIKYTYYDDGALKSVEIYNNHRIWGTYHSTRYYQYDISGRCIYIEGYLTHGGDEVFYLYHETEKTPAYAVVFDGYFTGHDEMLRVYEYK